MNSPVAVSLGNWPTQPSVWGTLKVSPNTSRILKSANIRSQDILPISMVEYIVSNRLASYSQSQIEDTYFFDMERRRKKAEILQQKWKQIGLKRSKSMKLSNSPKPTSSTSSNDKRMKRSFSKCPNIELPKNCKLKQKFHYGRKKNTSKKTSSYFDYYNTKKHPSPKKDAMDEDSTRSRKQNPNVSNANNEYFEKKSVSQANLGKKGKKGHDWLAMMSEMLKKWSDLEKKHKKELQVMSYDLLAHERKRLMKIHQIEMQKLKIKIERLKAAIQPETRLSTCS